MQTWKCPQCNRTHSSQRIILPVRCACGLVDMETHNIAVEATGDALPLAVLPVRMAYALTRWLAAGKPTRDEGEITALLENFCKKCPYYKNSRCSHPKCGCQIRSVTEEQETVDKLSILFKISPALVNKLRLGTEHCPEGLW